MSQGTNPNTNFIYDRISRYLSTISDRMFCGLTPITGLEYCECGYKSGNQPPRGQRWVPLEEHSNLGEYGKEFHFWIKGKIVIPEELRGQRIELYNSSFSDRAFLKTPQMIIYLDNKIAAAFDQFHDSILLDSTKAEQDFLIYLYTADNTKIYDFSLSLRQVDELSRKLYYDVRVPLDILSYSDEDSREYGLILNALNSALNLVDFRDNSDRYRESVKAAIDSLDENLYKKYTDSTGYSCVCIGHSHIDVAWLWTFAQTKEKVQRTFANVINLMKRYPEYKFMSSQAQLYKFCKEESPELYAEIKEMVKAGRWEVEGSSWVEPDCNITGGESLIRQMLYGKRFFMNEFGVDCKVFWIPDSFGFTGALPQILSKCGIKYVVTSKLSWNETDKMPYDVFRWKGNDGSEVLTYFITTQDKQKAKPQSMHTTYNGNARPGQYQGAWERFQQKTLSDEVLVLYGAGDGGGGPTSENIEYTQRLAGGLPLSPKTKFDFAHNFLDKLADNVSGNPDLPQWRGELYLEYHRGTLTSQAKNKKNNRKAEFLYENAEMISVIGELLCNVKYPKKELRDGWEKILLCQFHDVLPGSSVAQVYADSDKIYDEVFENGHKIVDPLLAAVSGNIKTYGGLFVFNPNSFSASAQVMAEGEWRYVENIPGNGWAVVAPADRIMPNIGDHCIDNEYIYLHFDENMNIDRLYDKRAGRDVLPTGQVANRLIAYEDIPRDYDAWEISNYYKQKSWPIDNVVSVKRYECGEKLGFTVERKFDNSTICQTISIDGHTTNIGFETEIDWKNDHILLKADFPLDINTTRATYDVQFGAIERSTHKNTSWDAAKFEVCGHKFADLSENGYGVSLINDCKYGYSAEGSVLSLTLLKSATSPDRGADKCVHNFTYTLYPHVGDYTDAGTVENAYVLNNPLVCIPLSRQDGNLPDKFSLVKTDGRGTIIETVKKSELGDGYIVRLYDAYNMHAKRTVTFGIPVKAAFICDMLETELKPVEVSGKNVVIDIKPFEIVTLKVKV
ncbi:MAG: alpha-mannosidase [Clostridia bacterium]|nr:alpha-mannosidase [Clostridia bacterium]